MSRRMVREKVIQVLYELEFQPEAINRVMLEYREKLSSEDFSFFSRLINGILKDSSSIDQLITPYLKKGWSLQRISILERSILRLAVYEFTQEQATPSKVVINEAVELAKRFGGTESRRFINGILGKLLQESIEKR